MSGRAARVFKRRRSSNEVATQVQLGAGNGDRTRSIDSVDVDRFPRQGEGSSSVPSANTGYSRAHPVGATNRRGDSDNEKTRTAEGNENLCHARILHQHESSHQDKKECRVGGRAEAIHCIKGGKEYCLPYARARPGKDGARGERQGSAETSRCIDGFLPISDDGGESDTPDAGGLRHTSQLEGLLPSVVQTRSNDQLETIPRSRPVGLSSRSVRRFSEGYQSDWSNNSPGAGSSDSLDESTELEQLDSMTRMVTSMIRDIRQDRTEVSWTTTDQSDPRSSRSDETVGRTQVVELTSENVLLHLQRRRTWG